MRMFRSLLFPLLLLTPVLVHGQRLNPVRHLTIFDANVAEFMEERMLDLQPGLNSVEFRSLMPQAFIRTLRVTGDRVTVVRQNITYDGPDVRNQKSPVLHLVLQNSGAAGPRAVQVDYLAPGLSWKGDYSIVLAQPANGTPPAEMLFDGWVTVQNDTSTDISAGAVDLVAGDVQLLVGGGRATGNFQANAQIARFSDAEEAPESAGAEVTGVSVFSRMRLGRDISMTANTTVNRFPLFQQLKLEVEQRNVFENDARTQTLGRGGFMLLPRGLEVRLVSRNTHTSPLPAGTVTVYSREGEVAQVVGQDRIPLTPVKGDFSITQGRSNVLQGTRRVVERHEELDPQSGTQRRNKLVTRVEVVISNRGDIPSTAFVREGVEEWGNRNWTVTQSSHPNQKQGDRMMEFRLPVPPKGSVTLEYTIEIR
jgi:hypothetical protein